jgi:S-adenosylmethionine-diacylgycerolhomoserine-N-methlytransferase
MDATQQLVFNQPVDQATKMQGYYRFHAKIYDLTRWTFLFGRQWLLDWLPFSRTDSSMIMEVGCGTGFNLLQLANRFHKAQLMGVDVSAEMLDIADKKLISTSNLFVLKQRTYGTGALHFMKKPDCILFSYCLTMVNPNWENLVLQAKKDLKEDGIVAIVDFHQSKISWFRRWMQYNHVRMEGHILPFLAEHFETVKLEKRRAYFGLWSYFLYIGKIKQ